MNRIAAVIAPESINTPTKAKQFVAEISAACFNDEIRAIVAAELLSRIVTSVDGNVARKHSCACRWATALTAAYDRQFRD